MQLSNIYCNIRKEKIICRVVPFIANIQEKKDTLFSSDKTCMISGFIADEAFGFG